MTRGRRGFTLIEALIAITVLMILSAVTIFSTRNMLDSAEANNIITNMMHIKTAVLMWYKENSSKVTSSYSINSDAINYIKKKYLDNTTFFATSGTGSMGYYSISSENKKWYVRYNIGSITDFGLIKKVPDMDAPSVRIREKLAGNAKTYGLSGKEKDGTLNSVYTNEQFVYMLIIDFNK